MTCDGDVLAKLAAIPMREWNYKAQGAAIRHMGPTAQDFPAPPRPGRFPAAGSTPSTLTGWLWPASRRSMTGPRPCGRRWTTCGVRTPICGLVLPASKPVLDGKVRPGHAGTLTLGLIRVLAHHSPQSAADECRTDPRHVPLAAAAVLQRRDGQCHAARRVCTMDGYDDQCGATRARDRRPGRRTPTAPSAWAGTSSPHRVGAACRSMRASRCHRPVGRGATAPAMRARSHSVPARAAARGRCRHQPAAIPGASRC